MPKFNAIKGFFDSFFFMLLSLNLIDSVPTFSIESFSDIDTLIKFLMTVAGLVYFVQRIFMMMLDRKIKQEELKKKIKDNKDV